MWTATSSMLCLVCAKNPQNKAIYGASSQPKRCDVPSILEFQKIASETSIIVAQVPH